MTKSQIILTGADQALNLVFHNESDGTVTMEVCDSEGGGLCYGYLAFEPEGLLRKGRIYQTPQGVQIQTGTVLAEDGTGRGVAWRINFDEKLEKVWQAEMLVMQEDASRVFGMTGLDRARAKKAYPKAKQALYALIDGLSQAELEAYAALRKARNSQIKREREEISARAKKSA